MGKGLTRNANFRAPRQTTRPLPAYRCAPHARARSSARLARRRGTRRLSHIDSHTQERSAVSTFPSMHLPCVRHSQQSAAAPTATLLAQSCGRGSMGAPPDADC